MTDGQSRLRGSPKGHGVLIDSKIDLGYPLTLTLSPGGERGSKICYEPQKEEGIIIYSLAPSGRGMG